MRKMSWAAQGFKRCRARNIAGVVAGALVVGVSWLHDLRPALAQPAVIQEPARPAERRVALIVGNSAYRTADRLRNPVADASAMQVVLQRLNFELIVGLDLTHASFKDKVAEFTKAIRNADIALFFYAGHGVQYGEQNYLLPTDIELTSEAEVTAKSLALNELLESMGRNAKASVIFLDACRDSPQFRSISRGTTTAAPSGWKYLRGLAGLQSTKADRFVGFAAAPGTAAEDGRGKNSPFTEALLRHIPKPDVEINAMFTAVRADVVRATRSRQRPEALHGLSKALYLKPGANTPVEYQDPPPGDSEGSPSVSLSRDGEFWMAIRDTNDPRNFEEYLVQFPSGRFAGLAKRRLEFLKLPPRPPEARPRPTTADLPTTDIELVLASGTAQISKDHPKEEAQRSARALARAKVIATKVQMAGANLPATVTSSSEAAELLGYLGRGIPFDEVWTFHPATSGEAKVELRAKVRSLGAPGERKLVGNLESPVVVAAQPIRLKVTARKESQIGVFAWQADGTVLRLYPESTRRQPVLIKAGETIWFPRANDAYPAIASANMPGERSNHEALIVVTGARMGNIQFEQLVPTTVAQSTQHSSSSLVDATEFLRRLSAIPDPELELLVLPYEVVAARQ